jgi:hypothetical protein
MHRMQVQQILQKEIQESKRWVETAEGVYKRDLIARIELINWVLDNMKNPDLKICDLMESKMNDTILRINQTNDIFQADVLHSELRILEWIFYQVCSNEIKKFERI